MSEVEGFVYRVQEAADLFRNALLALAPLAEDAGLTWSDDNPHDDWDRLAESVYEVFVAKPLSQGSPQPYPLPRYDYDLTAYGELSWLECEVAGETGPLVFLRLLTDHTAFDTVQVVRLDPTDLTPRERLSIRYADIRWLLRRRFPSGSAATVSEVSLEE